MCPLVGWLLASEEGGGQRKLVGQIYGWCKYKKSFAEAELYPTWGLQSGGVLPFGDILQFGSSVREAQEPGGLGSPLHGGEQIGSGL